MNKIVQAVRAKFSKKSTGVTASKNDNYELQSQNYWLWIFINSLIFTFVGLELINYFRSGFLYETGRVLISGGLALVITSIVTYFRNKTIEKNLVAYISHNLRGTVEETFRIIQHKIYPDQVYICDFRDGEDNLFNKKLNSCMQQATSFRFMSISGTYLLKNRLSKVEPNHDIDMQLLFQNPCDTMNLDHRAKQLERFESKTVSFLQQEIIESVIRAYVLQLRNNSFKIRLRFHTAPPLCRIEFSGADDLFVSYYKSQEGPKNYGPVAHYGHMQGDMENDVFRSFNYLFNLLWDSNGRRQELNFREGINFNSPHDLVAALKTCLSIDEGNLCQDIFSELSVARILEKLIDEYMIAETAMTSNEGMQMPGACHYRIIEWLDKGRLLAVTNEQNDANLSPHRFSRTHCEGLWHRVVHIEIKNRDEYFVWQRHDGRYEIPGGHVSWIAMQNRAETYEEAALRELTEELNLPWNWKILEEDCKKKLKDSGRLIGSPFKNELSSTHGNNKEWVNVYELTWSSDWVDPCKAEVGQEGKNPKWLTLEEIRGLHAAGAGMNAALRLFLVRHAESV